MTALYWARSAGILSCVVIVEVTPMRVCSCFESTSIAGISSATIRMSVAAVNGAIANTAKAKVLKSIIWYCFRPYSMQTKYKIFNRSRLLIKPLGERIHDLDIGSWQQIGDA